MPAHALRLRADLLMSCVARNGKLRDSVVFGAVCALASVLALQILALGDVNALIFRIVAWGGAWDGARELLLNSFCEKHGNLFEMNTQVCSSSGL